MIYFQHYRSEDFEYGVKIYDVVYAASSNNQRCKFSWSLLKQQFRINVQLYSHWDYEDKRSYCK